MPKAIVFASGVSFASWDVQRRSALKKFLTTQFANSFQGGVTGAFQKIGEKIPGTTAWNDAHGKYDSPTHDVGPVGQTDQQGAEGTGQCRSRDKTQR